MGNYRFVTVNPSDYAIVFKKGNIIKEGRGFRFFCTPRIQYVIIPGNVKNITFAADQISRENQGVEVSGFAIWKVGEPKKIYQHFDFKQDIETMEQVSEFLKDVVESAIRHMVANMTIEEVLRKRGTIILQLKKELEYITEQWGIIVETIEIKNVRILSKTLFDNMQAKFRNAVRLEAETNSIETEKQIEEQRIQVGDETKIIRQKSELADRERKKQLQLQEINDTAEVEKHQREIKQQSELEDKELMKQLLLQEINDNAEVEKQQKEVMQQSELAERERKKQLQLQDISDKMEVERDQFERLHAMKKEDLNRKLEIYKEEEKYKRQQMLEQKQTLAEEEKIQTLVAELELKKKQLEVELEKHEIEIKKLQVETENLRKDHRIIMAENLPAMLQNLKIERLDLGGTTMDTLLESLKRIFENKS